MTPKSISLFKQLSQRYAHYPLMPFCEGQMTDFLDLLDLENEPYQFLYHIKLHATPYGAFAFRSALSDTKYSLPALQEDWELTVWILTRFYKSDDYGVAPYMPIPENEDITSQFGQDYESLALAGKYKFIRVLSSENSHKSQSSGRRLQLMTNAGFFMPITRQDKLYICQILERRPHLIYRTHHALNAHTLCPDLTKLKIKVRIDELRVFIRINESDEEIELTLYEVSRIISDFENLLSCSGVKNLSQY